MKELAKKEESAMAEQEESVLMEMVRRTDISPERLEAFMNLQFKAEAKQAEREFNAALSAFQGECPIIKKTRNVSFKSVNYDYSPLEEMVGVIKPLLNKYKLSFSFDVKEASEANKMVLITKIRHSAGHSEETSYFFNKYHDDERMNLSQRAKSSVTFAKRAALENALGLVTEKDVDADSAPQLPDVSNTQIDQIKKLVEETKSDLPKFLKFLKAESIDALTPEQAQRAFHALKQKAAK